MLFNLKQMSHNLTKWVLTLSQTSPGFYLSAVQVFKNTVRKGEIARNEQFLLFPQCFPYPLEEFSSFFIKFEIVVCRLFQLGRVQNLSLGEKLLYLLDVYIKLDIIIIIIDLGNQLNLTSHLIWMQNRLLTCRKFTISKNYLPISVVAARAD